MPESRFWIPSPVLRETENVQNVSANDVAKHKCRCDSQHDTFLNLNSLRQTIRISIGSMVTSCSVRANSISNWLIANALKN